MSAARGDADLWRSASHPLTPSKFWGSSLRCSLPHLWRRWWWKWFILSRSFTNSSQKKIYKSHCSSIAATNAVSFISALLHLSPNNSHIFHPVSWTLINMPTLDAITPPKPSSLPPDIVTQLLINLDDKIDQLKSSKGGLDIEGLIAFQRVANYLWVSMHYLMSPVIQTVWFNINVVQRHRYSYSTMGFSPSLLKQSISKVAFWVIGYVKPSSRGSF